MWDENHPSPLSHLQVLDRYGEPILGLKSTRFGVLFCLFTLAILGNLVYHNNGFTQFSEIRMMVPAPYVRNDKKEFEQ